MASSYRSPGLASVATFDDSFHIWLSVYIVANRVGWFVYRISLADDGGCSNLVWSQSIDYCIDALFCRAVDISRLRMPTEYSIEEITDASRYIGVAIWFFFDQFFSVAIEPRRWYQLCVLNFFFLSQLSVCRQLGLLCCQSFFHPRMNKKKNIPDMKVVTSLEEHISGKCPFFIPLLWANGVGRRLGEFDDAINDTQTTTLFSLLATLLLFYPRGNDHPARNVSKIFLSFASFFFPKSLKRRRRRRGAV